MTKEAVIKNVNELDLNNVKGDIKEEFCKLWPTLKSGLELLKKIVPSLTFFIDLVIGGGDALAKRICG